MKPMTAMPTHPAIAHPANVQDWLRHMKHKAAHNIAETCGCDEMAETEEEVKKMVAYAKKHGDCRERAEVEYEANEFMWADNTLKMMEHFPSVIAK